MSMDNLRARFRDIQGIQDDFLHRIRRYKETNDPSVLPDETEADNLDSQLEDLVKGLSHPVPEPLNAVVPRRSTSSRQFQVVESPRITILPPLQPLPSPTLPLTPDLSTPPITELEDATELASLPVVASSPTRRRKIDTFILPSDPVLPPVSLGPIGAEPTFGSVFKEIMVSSPQPQSDEDDDIESSVPESIEEITNFTGRDGPSPPRPSIGVAPEVKSELVIPLSPSRRQRHEPIPFVVDSPASPPVVEREQTPDLMYVSPTPPPHIGAATPPVAEASIPPIPTTTAPASVQPAPVVPAAEPATATVSEVPKAGLSLPPLPVTPKRVLYIPASPVSGAVSPFKKSPLRDSNLRRREGDPKLFWKSVRDDRVVLDQILVILKAAEKVQQELIQSKVRVKNFGLTGQYLFDPKERKVVPVTPPVSLLEEATVVVGEDTKEVVLGEAGTEVVAPVMESVNVVVPSLPVRPVRSVDLAKLMMAARTIQQWYKRWLKRKQERMMYVASIAENEAVDARAALRKRRLERRQQSTPVAGFTQPTIPVSAAPLFSETVSDWVSSLLSPVNTQQPAQPVVDPTTVQT